jgi:hypothetical protein
LQQSHELREGLQLDAGRPFRIELDENQERLLRELICGREDISEHEEKSGYCVARDFGKADLLSYDLHRDRELSMMLAGEKPMSFFTVEEGFTFEYLCEQPFQQFVARGVIEKNEFSLRTLSQAVVTYVVFTLPGETWRFHCLRFLKTARILWDGTLERLEGLLLGYSEEQCDEYMALFWNGRHKISS